MKNKLAIIWNGILKENPTFVLVLGTCPTLATTTSVKNGAGMGVSTMAVLICSNVAIALLRKVIPNKVRIPCYIVVVAGFVTVVSFLLQAYVPSVYSSLGLYIPLIVVNCIILGRAEMFANKNTALDSALDGLGMGIGFTLALCIMGSIREILGSGTWCGLPVTSKLMDPISIFALAPGAFLTFGCVIALINYLTHGKGVKRKSFGCDGCPAAGSCDHKGIGCDEAPAKEAPAAAKAEAAAKTAPAEGSANGAAEAAAEGGAQA